MLKRRGADAGITDLHPHAFRHTWAHAFRAAGGNEGDLMLLGGWRSRAMLDRYGKAAAADRLPKRIDVCRWATASDLE
jgi:integrase